MNSLVHTFITNITIQETFLQIISHIFGNFGVKFLYRLLKYNTKRIRYHVRLHIHLYQLSVTCMDKVHSGIETKADFNRTEVHILVSCRNHSSIVSFVHVLLLLFGAVATQQIDQSPNFQHCNLN